MVRVCVTSFAVLVGRERAVSTSNVLTIVYSRASNGRFHEFNTGNLVALETWSSAPERLAFSQAQGAWSSTVKFAGIVGDGAGITESEMEVNTLSA